jgi:uncharacterized membrane protein
MAICIRLGGLYAGRYLERHAIGQAMFNAIPGCLLVSLVVPDLLSRGVGGWVAAAMTFVLMRVTRNMTLSMLGGVAAMALLRVGGITA